MNKEYIAPEVQITMLCPTASIALIEDSDFRGGEKDAVIVSLEDIVIDIP